MARYRFPGRPGHKIGRSGALFSSEEARNFQDPTSIYASSILRGLKRFRELVGDSDEEEEFIGFSAEEVGIKAYRQTTKGVKQRDGEKIPSLPLSSETLKRGSCMTTRLSHARLSLEALPASERTRGRLKTLIRKSYKDLKKDESNEFRTTTHIIKRVKEIEDHVVIRSPPKRKGKTKLIVPSPIKSVPVKSKISVSPLRSSPVQSKYPLIKKVKRLQEGQLNQPLAPKLKKLKIRLVSDGKEAKIVRGRGRPSIYEKNILRKDQKKPATSVETEQQAVKGTKEKVAKRVRVVPATKKVDTNVVKQILQKAKRGRPRKYPNPISPSVSPKVKSHKDRTDTSSSLAKTTNQVSKTQPTSFKTSKSLKTQPALSKVSKTQLPESAKLKKAQTKLPKVTKSAKMSVKSQTVLPKEEKVVKNNEKTNSRRVKTLKDDTVTMATPVTSKGKPKLDMATPVTGKGKPKLEKPGGHPDVKSEPVNNLISPTSQIGNTETPATKANTFKGVRRQFVLPTVSARSSRVIKPSKRFLDDDSSPIISAKLQKVDTTPSVTEALNQTVDAVTTSSSASDRDRNQYLQTESKSSLQPCDSHGPLKDGKARSRQTYRKPLLVAASRRKEKSPEKKKTEEIAAKLTKKAKQGMAKKSSEMAKMPQSMARSVKSKKDTKTGIVEKEVKQEMLSDVMNEGTTVDTNVTESPPLDSKGVKGETTDVSKSEGSQVVTPERRSKRKVLLKQSVARLLGRDRKQKKDTHHSSNASAESSAATSAMQNAGSGAATSASSASKKDGKKVAQARRPSELVKKAKLQLQKAALNKTVKKAENVKKEQLAKLNTQLEMEQKRVHSPVDLKSFPVVSLESLTSMENCDNATHAARHEELPKMLQTANMSQPDVKENKTSKASDDEADTSDDVSTTSSNSTRGPRIKHVCRRAAVVLGQQRAMFEDDNHELRLSALPEREKEKLREKKEEKPIGSDDETPQLSPKKESKTTPKEDSPVKRRKVPMYRKRRRRCGQCEGCLRVEDCRKCEYCLDKSKYGGPNVKKQCCIHKKCKEPLPALEAPDVAPKAPRPKRERVPPSKLQKKKKEERPNQNPTAVPGSSVAVRPKTTPVVTDGKLIKIEYKQEDYEVESIWDYGMPIISTMPLVTRTVCFLCASTGKHELVYCNVCCEPFHEFCLEDDEKPLEGHADTWCCRRCKFCQVCGRQQNLLQCDKCHNTYHAECLGPNYPTKPTKRKKVWICTKCVRCKSCGATTPGQSFNAQWSHDFSLCQDCGKLFDKGNYCPLCQQCYTDDDYESKMMQCASCESWVHSKCEGLTDEMYQIMCELPEDIHYTCSKCKPEKPAQWQIDIKEEMQAGFQLVLGQLLATKSIEQLFKRKEKKEEPKESTKTEKVEKDRAVESVQTKATSSEQIPQAEQPMEVECGEEQGQHANEVRSESTNQDQPGQEPTNQIQCSESATQGEDTKEMKPTQESCADVEMTNQEQACSQDDVPNTETNTDGNKETVTQFDTFHKLDSPFPEHDNKSSESTDSAISETPEVTSKLEKSDESAGQLVCRRDLTIGRTCVIGPPRKHHAVDLFDMRDRMNEGKYTSVSAFSDDIVKIIQESISSEKDENASLKRGNRVAKSVFIKQMEKVFPWFNVHSSSFWEHNKNLPDGMLPNAVLPPHPDHEYAQWREKYSTEPTTPQPSPLKKIPPTPNKFFASDDGVFDLPMDSVGEDTRRCCLCGHFGDDEPNDAGRLLYCGQDEWIHINCALWSAEVFEEVDGSLINVHPAITRGRQMRCEHCNRFGATVGCCMRGCPANFHFMCARTEHAVFQEDKKVFCDAHHNKVDHELVEGDNFSVLRRVCVNMEGMKLKKELLKGWDPNSINVLTGAMTVEYLGSLSSLSDTKAALFPIDFKVTRVYWSTVDTRRRCIYTITIKEYKPCKPVTQIQDMNRTVVHNITLPSGIDDINYTIPHESETSPMEETSGDLDGGNMATDDVTGIVQMPVNVELESDGQGQGAVVMEVDDAVALATEYLTQADDEVSEILARQNQLPCETDPEFTQSTNTEVTERSQETQACSIASVGGLAPSTLKMLPPARLKSLTSKPVMDLTASPDYTASPRRLSIIAERLNAGAVGAKCAKEIKFPESVRDNYAAAENTAHNKSSEISENEQSSLVSSPDVIQTVDRTEFLENSEEQDTSSDNLEGNDESGLVLDIADSDLQLSDSALELMALNSDNLSVSNSIPAASSTTTSASNSMAAIDENSAQQIAQIEQELEEVGKTVMQCSGKYSGSIAETVGANLTNEEVNALVQKAITSVTATSECEMDISGNDDEESDVLAPSSDRQLDSVTTYGISDERRQTVSKFITSPVNNYSTSAGNQTEQDTEHSNASCDVEFVSDSNELGTVERESEISVSAATDCTTDHIADSVTDPTTDHSADSVTDYSTNHTSDSVTDKSESSVQDLSNTSADVPSSERTSFEEADSNAAGQHSTIRNQQSLLMVAPHTTTSTDAMKTDRKEKFLEEVESSVQGGKLSVEDESIEKDPKEEESVQVAPSYERSPDIETEKSKSETMATHLSDGEEQGEAERQTEANRRQRNNSEESENEVNERRTFLEGNSADAVAEEASRDEEQVGVDDEHSEEVQNLLFLCQYCGKGYKSKGPFTKHQRVCEEVRCDDQDDQFEKDLDIIDVSVHGRKRYPMRSTKTRLLRIVDYGTPTLPKPNKSPGKEEMVSPTQRRGRKKSLGSAESIIEEETMSPIRENERSDEGQDETVTKNSCDDEESQDTAKSECMVKTRNRSRQSSLCEKTKCEEDKKTEEVKKVRGKSAVSETPERCRRRSVDLSASQDKSRRTSVDSSSSQDKPRTSIDDNNLQDKAGSVPGDMNSSQDRPRRASVDQSTSPDKSQRMSVDENSAIVSQSDGVFHTDDMKKIAAMKELNPVVLLNKCDEKMKTTPDSAPALCEQESLSTSGSSNEKDSINDGQSQSENDHSHQDSPKDSATDTSPGKQEGVSTANKSSRQEMSTPTKSSKPDPPTSPVENVPVGKKLQSLLLDGNFGKEEPSHCEERQPERSPKSSVVSAKDSGDGITIKGKTVLREEESDCSNSHEDDFETTNAKQPERSLSELLRDATVEARSSERVPKISSGGKTKSNFHIVQGKLSKVGDQHIVMITLPDGSTKSAPLPKEVLVNTATGKGTSLQGCTYSMGDLIEKTLQREIQEYNKEHNITLEQKNDLDKVSLDLKGMAKGQPGKSLPSENGSQPQKHSPQQQKSRPQQPKQSRVRKKSASPQQKSAAQQVLQQRPNTVQKTLQQQTVELSQPTLQQTHAVQQETAAGLLQQQRQQQAMTVLQQQSAQLQKQLYQSQQQLLQGQHLHQQQHVAGFQPQQHQIQNQAELQNKQAHTDLSIKTSTSMSPRSMTKTPGSGRLKSPQPPVAILPKVPSDQASSQDRQEQPVMMSIMANPQQQMVIMAANAVQTSSVQKAVSLQDNSTVKQSPVESRTQQKITTRVSDGVGSIEVQAVPVVNPPSTPYMVVNTKGVPVMVLNNQDGSAAIDDGIMMNKQLPNVSQTQSVPQSPVKVIVDMKSHNSATVVQQQLQPVQVNSSYALGKSGGLPLQSQACMNLIPQPSSQIQTLHIPGMPPVQNSLTFGGFQPPVVPTPSMQKSTVSENSANISLLGPANISPQKQPAAVAQNPVYSPIRSILQSPTQSADHSGNTLYQSTEFGPGASVLMQSRIRPNLAQGFNRVGTQVPQQQSTSNSPLAIRPVNQIQGRGMQVPAQGAQNLKLVQEVATNIYPAVERRNMVSEMLLQPALNSDTFTQHQLATGNLGTVPLLQMRGLENPEQQIGNSMPVNHTATETKRELMQHNPTGLPTSNPSLEQLIQGLSPQKNTLQKTGSIDAITQEVWQDLLKVMQPMTTVSRATTTPAILRNKSPVSSAYMSIPGMANLGGIPNAVTVTQVSQPQSVVVNSKDSLPFTSLPSNIAVVSEVLTPNGIMHGTSSAATTTSSFSSLVTNGMQITQGSALIDEHQIAKNTSNLMLSDAARQAMMPFKSNTTQYNTSLPSTVTHNLQTAVPSLVGVGLRQISPPVQDARLTNLMAQQNLQYSTELAKIAVTSSSNLGASAALRSIVQQNHLHGAFLAPVSLLPPLQNTNVSQQFTAQQSSTITSTATGVRRPARPDQITELSNILSAAGLDSLSNLSPAELASLHQALVTQSAIDLDLVSAKLFGTPKAKKRKHQQSNKRTKKPKTTQKPRQRNPSVWIDANGVMHGAVGREMVTIDTAAASEKSSPKTDVPGPSLAKPKPRIKNPGSTPSRPRMKHPTFQADESTSTFNPANSSWEKAVEERLKNADLSVYSLLREPPMLKDQKSGETNAEAEKGKKKRKRKEKLQAKNDDGATFDEGVSVTKPKKAKSKSRPKEPCVDLTNLPDESRDDDEEEDEDDAEAGSFLMKLMEQEEKRKMNEPPKIKDEPHLVFEVSSDDGFHTEADTISEAWLKVLEKVQETRNSQGMKYLSFAGVDGTRMIGITHDAVVYLTEQLYGAKNCRKYKFKFHQYETSQDFIDEEPPINPHGCARTECYTRRSKFDMFNFLASKHRKLAIHTDNLDEEEEIQHKSARRATSMDLPMAMRFRHLQRTSREAVGVYRSKIHGRGLFCKRPIDAGEMVIEYSGTVIRSVLTDKREKYYDSKGIGCYMFRIDDYDVVDATMHGNAARFINHSCEPNCFSRVIQVDGKKHIVIFASRKIMPGEELTYDYKFPFEEEKIPCTCGSKKCRKYLN